MSHIKPSMEKEMLKTIEKVWAKHPGLRLGQLLVNAINPAEPCPEIYYTEDYNLIDALNQLMPQEVDSSEVPINEIEDIILLHNKLFTIYRDKVAVDIWIHTQMPALGGKKPISLLTTKEGRKQLQQVLNEIKHGFLC
ncbi:MbcA/ParS/Xre antitoxin family protein [Colwellia sp. MB3u-4]|uniref:MbcA/ParS/Xre antitoxin family protein n=1 Tax=Colwellia sp. MB3u-4 TaxID=2759822 RepID=UPI0015F5B893|nr:MbcA/ParS/Xre antitoxin family protein [Colwellia sp. MB3u-4]MBA6289244.1 DUF2384 domain-containing protein [Colwellia sp. MB3u-4]